jgi:hypothetical protein
MFFSSVISALGKWAHSPSGISSLIGMGTSLLPGIINKGSNDKVNQSVNQTLDTANSWLSKAGGYADELTKMAPEYRANAQKLMAATGMSAGQAMKVLGEAGGYFSGILNDPQKLAEATATTVSDQAQQNAGNISALSRMTGRGGGAAVGAAMSPMQVRQGALRSQLIAKDAAASALPGIGQAYTGLTSTMGNLAGDFARMTPGLYSSAGELMTGGMKNLSTLSGMQQTNRARDAAQGSTWGNFAKDISGNILKNMGKGNGESPGFSWPSLSSSNTKNDITGWGYGG